MSKETDKKTLLEVLKELLGVTEDEGEGTGDNGGETSSEASNDNTGVKKLVDGKIENVVSTNKEKEDNVVGFVKPKIDKNGFFDLTNIEDADMKAFFKELNDNRKSELTQRKQEADNQLISKEIENAVSALKLAKGITPDVITKLIDKDSIKIGEDGKVVGIDEAVKTIQTQQSGLFIADKGGESSPLLEGFNPQSGTNKNVVPSSFVEAFSMMED